MPLPNPPLYLSLTTPSGSPVIGGEQPLRGEGFRVGYETIRMVIVNCQLSIDYKPKP